MLKGFKEFLQRGNVVDLAVAVVIGAAFTNIVAKLQDGLINPLISAIFGQPNLDSVGNFTLNNADFSIGIILTAVVNFLLVAAAVYFCIVLPFNTMAKRRAAKEAAEPEAPAADVALLKEIRDLLANNRQ